jgi:hypothetical protein
VYLTEVEMLLLHQAIHQVLQDIHTHQAGAAAVRVLIITGIQAVATDHQAVAPVAQAMVEAEVEVADIAGKKG